MVSSPGTPSTFANTAPCHPPHRASRSAGPPPPRYEPSSCASSRVPRPAQALLHPARSGASSELVHILRATSSPDICRMICSSSCRSTSSDPRQVRRPLDQSSCFISPPPAFAMAVAAMPCTRYAICSPSHSAMIFSNASSAVRCAAPAIVRRCGDQVKVSFKLISIHFFIHITNGRVITPKYTVVKYLA